MATPFKPVVQHDTSSPLPSLDEVFSKIKKPSQVSDTTRTSPAKFTTASSFIRPDVTPIDLTTPVARAPSEPIDPDEGCIINKIPAPGQKRYRRKKKLLEWKPKPPKQQPPPPAGEDEEKPWRKYQSPEPKKPKARAKAKKKEADEPVRSRHFSGEPSDRATAGPEPEAKEPKRKRKSPEEPLELAPASRRRVEWTPPPADDRVITIGSNSSNGAGTQGSQEALTGRAFGALLQDYERPADETPSLNRSCSVGLLGMKYLANATPLSGPSEPTNEAPTKKAPAKKKKKPRTITELATAAYMPEEPAEPELPQISVLDLVEQQADIEPRKGAKKTRAKPKKKVKVAEPEPILLSPNTAIRQVDAQAYVFGTSSQLVLGEMPPLASQTEQRRLHKDFVYRDEDPFATPINSDAVEPKPKQKLWEVGARDEDGKVIDLPIINLVSSPDPDAMGLEINPFGYPSTEPAPTANKGEASTDRQGGQEVVPEAAHPSPAPTQPLKPPILETQPLEAPALVAPVLEAPPQLSPAQAPEYLCSPPNSKATQQPPTSRQRSDPPRSGPAKPKYDLYTDVQLSREVAKFGFKSIKRRSAMISLLDQCWESKNRGARTPLSSLPSNRSISTTAASSAKAESPKRPRGRPRKTMPDPSEPPPSGQASVPTTAAAATPSPKRPRGRPRKDAPSEKPKPAAPRTPTKRSRKSVIEIPDSESEGLSPAPTSPGSEDLFSSPPGIDVTLSLDEQTEGSLAVGASEGQSSLMACITKAVKAAPPTKDPTQPSWHEKMLMYEPVILEDLAAWLNTGPLDAAGYEDEVSPAQVKQWCESKSVCCLWRMNLSGKERKRY